jgi:S-(hydroxymethyl)glutathione dehydrogenase / alcohol dehydrogenase
MVEANKKSGFMKAAVLYKTGEPLVVEENIKIPPLSPGQVLVKVAYSGICRSQLMEARGHRGHDPYLPHLLGHEGAGEVIEVTKGVKKVVKGDRVVLTWIKGEGANCKGAVYNKNDMQINSGGVTTFSNYTVVSENRCVSIPKTVPLDVATLLGCAIPTGAGIVMNTLRPSQGTSLAVFGAGGIGLSAIMATKLYDCSIIIVVDVEEPKLQKAKELGATHLINANEEDPVEKIKLLTGGKGVDYAIEAAGRAKVIEQAFQSVRNNGGLCVFAGHPANHERIQLDPFDLIQGKQILGSWGGECNPDRDIPALANYYLEGKLPLEKLITNRYKLEDINQALSNLENHEIARAILEMN